MCWKLLGVEPEIGAKFTVTFDVDGHTTIQTFILCGWWKYDEAVVANHILIPESQVDTILAAVGVTPPRQRRHDRLLESGCDAEKRRPLHRLRPGEDFCKPRLSVVDRGRELYLHRHQPGLHRGAAFRQAESHRGGYYRGGGAAPYFAHRAPRHLQCLSNLCGGEYPLLRPAENHRPPGSFGGSSAPRPCFSPSSAFPSVCCWAGHRNSSKKSRSL